MVGLKLTKYNGLFYGFILGLKYGIKTPYGFETFNFLLYSLPLTLLLVSKESIKTDKDDFQPLQISSVQEEVAPFN